MKPVSCMQKYIIEQEFTKYRYKVLLFNLNITHVQMKLLFFLLKTTQVNRVLLITMRNCGVTVVRSH